MKVFNMILLITAILLDCVPLTHAGSGFIDSCWDIQYEDTTLHARCDDGDESSQPNSLDLNTVITNLGGKLEFHDSGFAQTCLYCALSQTKALVCNCLTWESDVLLIAELDLNAHIGNNGGKFHS